MTKEFADALIEKVRTDYDTIATSFAETRQNAWPEMERFKEFVPKGGHVLDIGCGNGRAYQVFHGLAITYDGIDPSQGLISKAKMSVFELLAEFQVGNVLTLPFDDEGYDLAIAVASIHHLPSEQYRRMALREAYRVVKPGGYFVMLNWNRWDWKYRKEIASMMWRWISRQGYDFGDMLIPWNRGPEKLDRYYYAFRPNELKTLCEDVGFEVLENEMVQDGRNLMTICKRPDRVEVEFEEGFVPISQGGL